MEYMYSGIYSETIINSKVQREKLSKTDTPPTAHQHSTQEFTEVWKSVMDDRIRKWGKGKLEVSGREWWL